MSTLALDSYRRTQVQASTPLERVVMLYDGALRFMSVARDALDRGDIVARRDAMSRTMAIVAELQGSLDLERGGDIAKSLDRLYDYVANRLLDATMRKDPKAIDDARRVMETLRDAFQTIAATSSKGSAA